MPSFEYPVIVNQQTRDSKPVLLLAAPATEIEQWAGIPQRRRLRDDIGGEAVETVGFQREEKRGRVDAIATFIEHPENVLPNTLLVAAQDESTIKFEVDTADERRGTLTITLDPAIETASLGDLLGRLVAQLEARVPELAGRPVDDAAVRRMLEGLSSGAESAQDGEGAGEDELDSDQDEVADTPSATDMAALFEQETHLVEFYDEVRARREAWVQAGPADDTADWVGFTRDAVLAYLQPAVVVDGQHRLLGAIAGAEQLVDSPEGLKRAAELLEGGLDEDAAHAAVMAECVRQLPVSFLLDVSKAEHVFQFVVVNQLATPMAPDLLGTIVGTSLSDAELTPIADRLSQAGIDLGYSRAVANLSRAEDSPFAGLVRTGVGGDASGALPGTVLKSLFAVFQDLKGGILESQPKSDFAQWWRADLLPRTGLVDPAITDRNARYEAWREWPQGPARRLFIEFFTFVRDEFGDTDDMSAYNAWGTTRSNLYNKVSLTILAADFFSFLHQRHNALENWDAVPEALSDWVKNVKGRDYFNRDWRVRVKKDLPAVRQAWAATWHTYRQSPNLKLPDVRSYSP